MARHERRQQGLTSLFDPTRFNRRAHAAIHVPHEKMYTSMVPLDTTTGTDWIPQFAGRMTSVAINVLTGDEPASSTTIYDLQLNGTSVFSSDAQRPTIAVAATASNEEIVERGSWVVGDKWALQCTQTGGVNKVIVTLRYVKGD